MARSDAVWGIDIGQCALKAIRIRPSSEPGKVITDAFDFIEYPKILTQPEAEPAELIREALETFLSRNSVRGDRVAISVSGQSGLARFIKLPPVESKKIPDIVKYEARQQIPFALEDVVWDYQQMAGGSVEEGFALETEVGLFAMKREQVFRALKPFTDANIEVDFVQLTPLAIYNFVAFDELNDVPPVDQYDPTNPPESLVVISFGTDTTDLVVTNGYRVWQRTIPIGGNHFTKALTKELKLTFAKAEHLKRNAIKAEDPKAVYQAMRPVFNDLVTEIHRSLSYFTSLERDAKIGRVLALGNTMKLQGLKKYLAQNLGLEVKEADNFPTLTGPTVVNAPAFKDNTMAFGVAYGLGLQGVGESKIWTNLLPPEILKDRMIREKKPWAVAAVALLLLGFTLSYFGYWRAWNSANVGTKDFKDAFQAVDSAESTASGIETAYAAAQSGYEAVLKIGENLKSFQQSRGQWLELMAALNQCLPQDTAEKKSGPVDASKRPTSEELSKQEVIYIDSIDCERFDRLEDWFAMVKKYWDEDRLALNPGGASHAPAADSAAAPAENAAPASPDLSGPTDAAGAASASPGGMGPQGEGWVIQIQGHHFHNKGSEDITAAFVRRTLLKALQEHQPLLPVLVGQKVEPKPVKMVDLGVSFPVLLTPWRARRDLDASSLNNAAAMPVPAAGGGFGGGGFAGGGPGSEGRGGPGSEGRHSARMEDAPGNRTQSNVVQHQPALGAEQAPVMVDCFDFMIQFAWKPTLPSDRGKKPPPAEGVVAGATGVDQNQGGE